MSEEWFKQDHKSGWIKTKPQCISGWYINKETDSPYLREYVIEHLPQFCSYCLDKVRCGLQ